MLANSLTRARLRIGLIIIILATIPIYCGGLVMVQYARQPKAIPTFTLAPMPTSTTPSIMIATPYPTFTPSLTLVGPTDTPIPSATKPQTNTPSPTESPTETVTQTPTPTTTPTTTRLYFMLKPHHTALLIFTINILACLVPLSALADIVFVKASTTDFHHPHDLSLDPTGRLLFVADMNNDVVKILDPQTLTIVGKIGEKELSSPHDLTFDNQGRLVVADSGNSRLVVYELNGKQGKVVNTITNGMSSPEGVAVDKHHNIYVANTGSHNVVQLKNSNIALKAAGAGREIENYIRPHDVEIWNNRLFVTDPGNNRIKILNMQLQFILYAPIAL